jgi:hypothetical protein
MRISTLTVTAVLGTALAASACGDITHGTAPHSEKSAGRSVAAGQAASLEELTRALALAFDDAGLRHRVKQDMRRAPYSEHKLALDAYLRGASGGVLLAKMAKETGRTRDELLGMLERLGPMEFYMPVATHRESWTGGADLLVAGSRDEANATLVGFDLAGNRIPLSPLQAPATPTLVIVPQETDFTRELDPARSHNVADQNGQAIGTLLANGARPSGGPSMTIALPTCVDYCDDYGGAGGGDTGGSTTTTTVQQRGISVQEIITHMKTPNDHEPWTAGAPEFYLLLAGTHSGGAVYEARINIPEGPWSGSDDDNNSKWRNFGSISLITWDTDLGSRIRVQCMEDDGNWNATIKLTGSTKFPDLAGLELGIEVGFSVSSDDDNCGASYVDMRNSLGQWYLIPSYPNYDGTSDLHWYGYGVKRV